jgi:hypothetical protein
MTTELHEQFKQHVKTFESFAASSKKLAADIEALRVFLVQQENDAVSLEKQNKKAKAELEDIKRQMQDKRLMADANTRNTQERLDKRHLELVERESKIRIAEEAAAEQLRKANALVAAAEGATPKRRQAVSA